MGGIPIILLLLLLSSLKLEADPSDCKKQEQHFAILALAEESIAIARQLHPNCVEDDNFSNTSNSCESDRITANLDIALNLMTKAKEIYPDCDPKTVIINNTQTISVHKNPMDCLEIMENGRNKSGLNRVWLKNRIMKGRGARVFCDMTTDGGGWTVIQRRGQFGNSENFFDKTWEEYKQGFGNLQEEFWFGNEKIYVLTNQDQYSVRFELTDINGTSAFAEYKHFWIENEENKYKLHLSKYSGTAGDSLSSHSGSDFYAKDQLNQPKESKPEWKRSGGWWLNHIMTSSLNGLNLLGSDRVESRDGITWLAFGGFQNSLAFTEIKVRPKKFKT